MCNSNGNYIVTLYHLGHPSGRPLVYIKYPTCTSLWKDISYTYQLRLLDYYILVDCPTLNTDVPKESGQWTVAIIHYDSWECLLR